MAIAKGPVYELNNGIKMPALGSRVLPAAGGTVHTCYIYPAPITPVNGFWKYQVMKLISSAGSHDLLQNVKEGSERHD
jgi:hypothetical protein